jgi:hypothetical protein
MVMVAEADRLPAIAVTVALSLEATEAGGVYEVVAPLAVDRLPLPLSDQPMGSDEPVSVAAKLTAAPPAETDALEGLTAREGFAAVSDFPPAQAASASMTTACASARLLRVCMVDLPGAATGRVAGVHLSLAQELGESCHEAIRGVAAGGALTVAASSSLRNLAAFSGSPSPS